MLPAHSLVRPFRSWVQAWGMRGCVASDRLGMVLGGACFSLLWGPPMATAVCPITAGANNMRQPANSRTKTHPCHSMRTLDLSKYHRRSIMIMTAVGFEPTRFSPPELESGALDHSAKVSWDEEKFKLGTSHDMLPLQVLRWHRENSTTTAVGNT